MKKKYDIFISYRRKDTGDKAEHLKDLLERAGYENRVSFDRENLTGVFDVELARRIDQCKDFLLVVGKNSFNYSGSDYAPEQVELYNYLGTCSIEDFERKIIEMGPNAPIDFVRIEIARALNRKGLNIVPIALESSDQFDFSKIDFPSDIAGIKRHGAIFFSDNPNALFKDVMHTLRPRLQSKPRISVGKIIIPCILAALLGTGALLWQQHVKKENLRSELEKKYECYQLYLNKDLSVSQLKTIDDILAKMAPVKPDTLWMSQYEFTVGQWYGIKGEAYEESQKDFPMTNVSYGEIWEVVMDLNDMTNINFCIPSEEQWEYAAHSGSYHDTLLYSGSDSVDEVAWYKEKSGGKAHPSNGQQGKNPNNLDLFDMSGNVGEFCNTRIVTETGEVLYPVRGGNYASEASQVTVASKVGVDPNKKDEAIGFRLIIDKQQP